MGSLIVTCPNCGKEIKFESSVDKYNYHVEDLPYPMAEDLDGEEKKCECGEIIILDAEIWAYIWVEVKKHESITI